MTTSPGRIRVALACLLLCAAAVALACAAQDDWAGAGPLGSAGAHEHGVARMTVGFDDGVMGVEFIAPGASLYGFEGTPVTGDQLRARTEALQRLHALAGRMLELEGAGECRVTSVSVAGAARVPADAEGHGGAGQARALAHDHAHDHAHGHEHDDAQDHSAHTDEVASWAVSCSPPGPQRVRLRVCEVFEGIERVDLQVASPTGQRGGRVDACGFGFTP